MLWLPTTLEGPSGARGAAGNLGRQLAPICPARRLVRPPIELYARAEDWAPVDLRRQARLLAARGHGTGAPPSVRQTRASGHTSTRELHWIGSAEIGARASPRRDRRHRGPDRTGIDRRDPRLQHQPRGRRLRPVPASTLGRRLRPIRPPQGAGWELESAIHPRSVSDSA